MFWRVKKITSISILVAFILMGVFVIKAEALPQPGLLAKYKSMLNSAKGQIAKMKKMENEARQRNDLVVVNCIHPKYVTAKRLYDIANKSFQRLQSLKMKGGEGVPMELVNSVARKIKLSCDRISDLFKEAQQCLSISAGKVVTKVKVLEGKDLLPSEQTQIEVVTPPTPAEPVPPSGSK